MVPGKHTGTLRDSLLLKERNFQY